MVNASLAAGSASAGANLVLVAAPIREAVAMDVADKVMLIGTVRVHDPDGRVSETVPLPKNELGTVRRPLCMARSHALARQAQHREHGSGLGRWRWMVERTFAWLNQFRRLRVRYEKRADIHEVLLALACALLC